MVRKTGKGVIFDMEPAIEALGLDRIIETVGAKRVIELIGSKRFIAEIGSKRVIEDVGLDEFFANLSAADRRELKRRLQ